MTVQQLAAVATSSIHSLALMDELLAGTRAKRAETRLIAPQINFVISFTAPPGMNGITYGADWSSTPDPGSWLPVPDSGSGNTHTFSVPIGSHSSMFMRLTVTR